MEQLLGWTRKSPWTVNLITLLGLVSNFLTLTFEISHFHFLTFTFSLSDTMEQLLEWTRKSPWTTNLITLLGLVSSLRIAFSLLKNLRDLIWAYILPRIWPVDLVKTYGK